MPAVFAHGKGEVVDYEGNSHGRNMPSWIDSVEKKNIRKIEKSLGLKDGTYRIWFSVVESYDLKSAELKNELDVKINAASDLLGKKVSENEAVSMDISGLERLAGCWVKLEDDEGVEWYEVYSVYGMKNRFFQNYSRKKQ